MRKIAAVLAVLVAGVASANVKRDHREEPRALIGLAGSSAYSGSMLLDGFSVPADRAATIVLVEAYITGGGGGGAGNTVITLTDGTNTCTATIACSATSSAGVKIAAVANGAGTGCSYAAGATVTASVTTAGCTTTQPTAKQTKFWVRWL